TDYLADRDNVKHRDRVEEHLGRLSRFEQLAQIFFITDKDGVLLAAHNRSDDPKEQHPRKNYGVDYSYRDYFNRTGDHYDQKKKRHPYKPNLDAKGNDQPYVAQPCTSTTPTKKLFQVITISAPIYEKAKGDQPDSNEKKMIGLIGVQIDLEKLAN